jgi:flagellar protein FlbD
VIALHRITQPDQPVYLNPDLIQLVEAKPDTVVTLTNGSKILVGEPPADVARLVREWRSSILLQALESPALADHQQPANVLLFPTLRAHDSDPQKH